jgi:hypothetical protein
MLDRLTALDPEDAEAQGYINEVRHRASCIGGQESGSRHLEEAVQPIAMEST